VPTTLPHGCELGAILERENPVDSLVVKQYNTLENLPEGSVVAFGESRSCGGLSLPGLRHQYYNSAQTR
jgi:hydroxymethylbilane synthase